jgi:SAM-dependent methyltransferase
MPGANSSDSNQTSPSSPSSRVSQILDRRLPLYVYLEPLFVGRRVLELGCGAGAGADYLAARGAAHVMALDVEAGPIERARSRYRRANLEFRSVPSLAALGPADLPELYDVVVVPEGESLLRRAQEGAAAAVLAWRGLLTTGGRLVVAASSADRRGGGGALGGLGLGYYELSDALLPHFPRVQMFGVTPFAGFGVVEFDAGTDGLRIDSRLVEEEAEPPSAYVAVAGAEPAEGLGYALVQVPFSPIESELLARNQLDPRTEARLAEGARRLEETERRARARVEEAEGRIGELRRKLEDASVQSESAMRIARAQGEEIEELRARLRRAAEDRGGQDAEIGKLRRALAEADESVMSLTRRTAEEMSAVAERLAAGLRFEPPEPRERERLTAFSSGRDREEQARAREEQARTREENDRLRVTLSETEARASAAEQRLEEVATDARERQARLDDALERLRLAEDAIARERREVGRLQSELREVEDTARALDESEQALAARDDRIARLEGEKQDLAWRLAELEERLREAIARAVVSEGTRGQSEELGAARAARDRALAEFHRAAGAHVDEVTELRAAVAEQSALVAELEDAVAQAEGRATTAVAEAATLRKSAKALEDADRTRRTRLAELEGKLLRLEHERAAAAARGVPAANGEAERRLADLGRERDALRADLARGGARVAELEAEVTRLAARPPEPPPPAPEPGEAGEPARNGHDPALAALARELDGIHSGLRAEVDALADIERTLGRESQVGAVGGGGPAVESLLSATLDNYRRRASRLHDELEGIRRRWESLSPAEISGYLEELGEDLAELEK